MDMIRLLLLGLLLIVPGAACDAQQPTHATAAASSAHIPPQISSAQARQVLDMLNDPARRAQFAATLEAIVQLQPAAGAPAAEPPATTTPATTTPGATPPPAVTPAPPANEPPNMLGEISGLFRHLSAEFVAALRTVRSVPLLWGWLTVMATDPWAKGVLLDLAWRLALAMGAGLAVQWLITWTLRRPRAALGRLAPPATNDDNGHAAGEEVDGEARAEQGETEAPHRRRAQAFALLLRLPLVLGQLVLDVMPVVGFAVVAHVIESSEWGGDALARGVSTEVIDSYLVYAGLMCLARMVFAPTQPQLRLLNMRDSTAAYAMRWSRRVVLIGIIAPTIAEAGGVLGMSDAAREGLMKAGGFVDNILLAIIVLQVRQTVANWIAAPDDAHGFAATLRNRLAAVWHWIALFLLAAMWVISAVEIEHGFTRMLHFLAVTILVLLVGRMALILGLGLIERLIRAGTAASVNYPAFETRLALYHGALQNSVRFIVSVLGTAVLLQLWGLGTLDWLLGTESGHHLLSMLISLAATVLLGLLVWEAVHAATERHLARLTREAQGSRSARLRTLLPLLRTTLLIVILTVGGLMVLSEIGVNIGPLLAGAGIVGVAIGFGSQKLVQDLITGIFLLLENAMQVGDTVTVSGLTGTVENLSVRTIRLRAGDGSVHIIPFSSVTSVTNVNRGIGNASVSVTVAYPEDTDRVGQVLKNLVTEMRADDNFASRILSDLQLWGVDKVDGAGVTIVGQVVCTDSGRWSVQREFNRRMKREFQAQGIEILNPLRIIALVPPPPTQEEPA